MGVLADDKYAHDSLRAKGNKQVVAGAFSTWRAVMTAGAVCRTSFCVSSFIILL